MTITGDYKRYARERRTFVEDTNYAGGMRYVNDPLPEGFVQTLFNYNVINKGDSIEPREGLVQDEAFNLGADVDGYIIHHVATAVVENTAVEDTKLVRYTLVGKANDTYSGVDINDARIITEDEITGDRNVHTLDTGFTGQAYIKYDANSDWTTMHKMPMNKALHRGLFGSVQNYTYVLYSDGVTQHLGKLLLKYDGASAYTFTLEEVQPDEITAREAVNYGYNMLDDDPYLFDDTENALQVVEMLGILPYDPSTNILKFNGNVGETIKFRLNYTYPAAHSGKTYKAVWKVYDLTTNSPVETIQDINASPTYTPGDEISFNYPAPFKQFAMIVELYDSADTTKPIGAITLPSYYLSDDIKGSMHGIDTKNYNIASATGIADWNNRLVLWGVDEAPTVLFTSEINNPTYFPFPHAVDVFDEPIIGVVKYLGDLALFTTSTMYRISLDDTKQFMVHEVIQEKLYLAREDINTIKLVKNMIYFKSDDYFYMVVPKATTDGTNALQLAPISTNIEQLLDNFESSIREILIEVYETDVILGDSTEDFKLELEYYYNYLDGEDVANCYKFKIYTVEAPQNALYIEITLNYDTLLRNWKMKGYQTNINTLMPYRQTVTDEAVFVNCYRNAGNNLVQYVVRTKAPVDTFVLDNAAERILPNYQFLDTGHREHIATLKKRYREVQFRINNLEKRDLDFSVGFFVDDQTRKGIFKYDVVHNTDPMDPNYGLISVVRTLADATKVYGASVLGEWKLGLSQFPDLTIIKVRTKVTGKGYAGRMKLLSKNQIRYELLSNVWVYRMMNAR